MRKVISIIIAMALMVTLLLSLTSCVGSNENEKGELEVNELIALPKNATLTVGTRSFVNNSKSTETEVYLTYTSTVIYSLQKEYLYSSTVPDGYFPTSEESRYYYHWQKQTITQQELMGNNTTVTDTTYEYLPYAGGESVMVKTNITTTQMFDFNGGFVEKPIEYQIDLNGYFTSVEQATQDYPDLMAAAHIGNTTDKYYIDTVVPKTTNSTTNTYDNTYFYLTYEE